MTGSARADRPNGPDRPGRELARWVEGELGPIDRWSDRSWDHAESAVFEALAASGARAFLKVHRSALKLEQERRAYERWCPTVGGTPTLLGVRERTPGALLLSAGEGEPLDLAGLAAPEAQAAFGEAGRWLARLHALPVVDRDPVPIDRALAMRADAWAERARSHVDAATRRRVRELAASAWPAGSEVPARRACHRDFTARNWLWSDCRLTVIDFEHSRLDGPLVDHERVRSSIPAGRDDLRRAFEAGYGRALDAEEHRQLRALTAVSALTRVAWAVEHDDAEFERAGRQQLEAVLADG